MEFYSVGILYFATFTVFIEAAALDKDSICACPMIYSPVCGTDFKSYDNSCLLKCEAKRNPELKIKWYGPCDSVEDVEVSEDLLIVAKYQKTCRCPESSTQPVCDSNGKTHTSDCLFKCHKPKGTRVVREGPCEAEMFVDDPKKFGYAEDIANSYATAYASSNSKTDTIDGASAASSNAQ